MRLLLVEAHDMVAATVLGSMRRATYTIDWNREEETARQALLHEPYDLALLALDVARLNGTELLNADRKAGGSAPILILTERDEGADGIEVYLRAPMIS
jgi:two-component system response regulator QseB